MDSSPEIPGLNDCDWELSADVHLHIISVLRADRGSTQWCAFETGFLYLNL